LGAYLKNYDSELNISDIQRTRWSWRQIQFCILKRSDSNNSPCRYH